MPFPLPDLATRLDTPRLHLRSYQPTDAPWYCAMSLRNQAHLSKYEAENPVNSIRTVADAERVMSGFAADWQAGKAFFLAAFEKTTAAFVAQIYVGVVNAALPEFEVGFFADVGHEGQGYVSEAVRGVLAFLFGALCAHRVRLECDDTNERSARVAEHSGFAREGHIRENHLWPDGTLTGAFHYGLLATEYTPGGATRARPLPATAHHLRSPRRF